MDDVVKPTHLPPPVTNRLVLSPVAKMTWIRIAHANRFFLPFNSVQYCMPDFFQVRGDSKSKSESECTVLKSESKYKSTKTQTTLSICTEHANDWHVGLTYSYTK